jgi:endonuclease YncB( thermonuclease family)
MFKIVTLLAFLVALTCQAEVISGKVVGVADGDTITVLDSSKTQHKIRLAGIDAPERNQAFGERSRESLANLVAGKTVIVETTKRDRYGRSVGKVLLDGEDINLAQIQRGMGWFYRHYQEEQTADDRFRYDTAETEARQARRGLWSDRSPVPPWDFRRNRRP